jgi:hypothetical protein
MGKLEPTFDGLLGLQALWREVLAAVQPQAA